MDPQILSQVMMAVELDATMVTAQACHHIGIAMMGHHSWCHHIPYFGMWALPGMPGRILSAGHRKTCARTQPSANGMADAIADVIPGELTHPILSYRPQTVSRM